MIKIVQKAEKNEDLSIVMVCECKSERYFEEKFDLISGKSEEKLEKSVKKSNFSDVVKLFR